MTKKTLIPLAIIALLLGGAACSKKDNTQNVNENSINDNTNQGVQLNVNTMEDTEPQAINTNSDPSTNTNTTVRNEDELTPEKDNHVSGSLTIGEPEKNAQLESGKKFQIHGKAPDGQVFVRVKNDAGTVFITQSVTARNGEYSVNLTMSISNTTGATIEVFQKDSAGNETNLISIPITFKKEESEDVNDDTKNADVNVNTNSSDDTNTNDDSNSGY